ncbi:hypothetical protein K432DRAFT_382491 [Lepidopterella palustris CBS 459.81]|uniref:DUF7730 domain-containing protein n=1 Tax=Lepidopterella palustris CBS 459.81 TaxID=1314670 RepID=A0A8E2EAB1_9PEZI|nr:hypothetical protein K432DRAFT_382491 [Lepidopterella palustris CBS 459.81]
MADGNTPSRLSKSTKVVKKTLKYTIVYPIVYPIIMSIYCPFALSDLARKKYKKLTYQQRMKAQTPVPLSSKRANLLAVVASIGHRRREQDGTSRLLHLPAELRLRIWELVFEDVAVHIGRSGKKMQSKTCCLKSKELVRSMSGLDINLDEATDGDEVVEVIQCKCLGSGFERRGRKRPEQEVVRQKRERTLPGVAWGISGIFRVCRQVHAETISLLYTVPTFIVPTQLSLLHFARNISPSSLAIIRSLHLSVHFDNWRCRSRCGWFGVQGDEAAYKEWDDACAALKQMTGLQHCTVVIKMGGGLWHPLNLTPYFEQIARVAVEALRGRGVRVVLCGAIESGDEQLEGWMEWSETERIVEEVEQELEEGWAMGRWVPIPLERSELS